MALITPVTLNPVSGRTGGTAIGQVVASFTPAGGGDFIALNGQWLILEFSTAGTGITVTLDSVTPSSYGTDVNPVITLGTTDHQKIALYVPDLRFVQPAGSSNPGYLGLTYSAVTNLTARACLIS